MSVIPKTSSSREQHHSRSPKTATCQRAKLDEQRGQENQCEIEEVGDTLTCQLQLTVLALSTVRDYYTVATLWGEGSAYLATM